MAERGSHWQGSGDLCRVSSAPLSDSRPLIGRENRSGPGTYTRKCDVNVEKCFCVKAETTTRECDWLAGCAVCEMFPDAARQETRFNDVVVCVVESLLRIIPSRAEKTNHTRPLVCLFPPSPLPSRFIAALFPPSSPPRCLFEPLAGSVHHSPRRPTHVAHLNTHPAPPSLYNSHVPRGRRPSSLLLAPGAHSPSSFNIRSPGLLHLAASSSSSPRPTQVSADLCPISRKDTVLDLRYPRAVSLPSCVIIELGARQNLHLALVSAIYHSPSPIVSSSGCLSSLARSASKECVSSPSSIL